MSDRLRRYSPEGPTPEQIVLSIFFVVAATVYAKWQEGRFDRWEAECPGRRVIAPYEEINFLDGTNTYNVYHHGINLGPDNVTVSIVDTMSKDEIFGGTVRVDHDQTTNVSGLSFIERATSNQEMTGDLLELTEDQNNCVVVTLPK